MKSPRLGQCQIVNQRGAEATTPRQSGSLINAHGGTRLIPVASPTLVTRPAGGFSSKFSPRSLMNWRGRAAVAPSQHVDSLCGLAFPSGAERLPLTDNMFDVGGLDVELSAGCSLTSWPVDAAVGRSILGGRTSLACGSCPKWGVWQSPRRCGVGPEERAEPPGRHSTPTPRHVKRQRRMWPGRAPSACPNDRRTPAGQRLNVNSPVAQP